MSHPPPRGYPAPPPHGHYGPPRGAPPPMHGYPPPHHYGPPLPYMPGYPPPPVVPYPAPHMPYMPHGPPMMRPAPPLNLPRPPHPGQRGAHNDRNGPHSGPSGGPPPLELPKQLPALQDARPPEDRPMVVFVGKLPSDVPDSFLLSLLEHCGKIDDWKRAIDDSTKRPKNFAFCTFSHASAARRAVKLLNNFKVDYQEILVKLGKKEQELLEKLNLPDEPEKEEAIIAKLHSLIKARNLGARPEDDKGEKKEGAPVEGGGAGDDDEFRENPTIMSEIEKFRQAQAERDRRRDEERSRELKRKLEEQQRLAQEKAEREEREARLRKEREEREARVSRMKEEALAAVQARRSPTPPSDDDRQSRRRQRSRSRSPNSRSRSRSRSRSPGRDTKRSRGDSHGRGSSGNMPPDPQLLIQAALGSAQTAPAPQVADTTRDAPPPPPALPSDGSGDVPMGRKLAMGFSAKNKGLGSAKTRTGTNMMAAFGGDEDEERKSRPLIPLDHDEDGHGRPSHPAAAAAAAVPSLSAAKSSSSSSSTAPSDRQMALVNKIPKEKDALFAYPVDWSLVDKHDIVNAKLRGWVVKKVKEYLGEEEPTLIQFIVTKMAHHCAAKDLLKELRLVLEDDADTFMMKLWRLLVYHVLDVQTLDG